MKVIGCIVVGVFAMAFSCHAEKLRLSSPVNAAILDDDGSVVGKRLLKAGTIVELSQLDAQDKSAVAAEKKPVAEKSSGAGLKASGMSPMEFLNEKPKNSVTFMCDVELREDLPYEFRDKYKGRAYGFSVSAYGKTLDSRKILYAIVMKDSRVGKKLYACTKDGAEHGAMLKVHGLNTIENWSDGVIIDDFSPLPQKAWDILNKQENP